MKVFDKNWGKDIQIMLGIIALMLIGLVIILFFTFILN